MVLLGINRVVVEDKDNRAEEICKSKHKGSAVEENRVNCYQRARPVSTGFFPRKCIE